MLVGDLCVWPGPTPGDMVQAALQGGMPGAGWAGPSGAGCSRARGLVMRQVGLHSHSLVTSNSADLRDTGQGRVWQGGRAGHEVGLGTDAGVQNRLSVGSF